MDTPPSVGSSHSSKQSATGVETNGIYAETEVKKSWFSFNKPSAKSPEEQLELSDKLLAEGSTKAAGKAYSALVTYWPRSVQAAAAQQRFAETLVKRGEVDDAFEQYDILIDRYVGSFDYEEVIATQFELAKKVLAKRRGGFLMFGGWKAPERAIPLFESIIKHAPRWSGAAEAQYLIGQAHEMNDDLELAIVAYMSAQNRYPDSPFAEKAALGRVRSLTLLSQESRNDEELMEQAYASAILYLQTFPQAEHVDTVTTYRDDLLTRRALLAYERGKFYDKIARNPKAALMSYESFTRMYPKSEWTPVAQARIAQLRPLVPAEKTP